MNLSTNFKDYVKLIFIITYVVMLMLINNLKTVGNSGVFSKYRFLFLPNMDYFFTNTLDITTSSLSLDYINPKIKKN